jgi:hypothetical protein
MPASPGSPGVTLIGKNRDRLQQPAESSDTQQLPKETCALNGFLS